MEMNEKTVGMLSKFTGVSVHTIKYYEKIGLISSERGEQSNYRFYGVRSCTDIYECVKYRNMGFSLKEIQCLFSGGKENLLEEFLEKRNEELSTQADQIMKMKSLVEKYQKELRDFERKSGKWYIEECKDFYFRRQTKALNYMEDGAMEASGINLIEYAPESYSVLELLPEYFWGKKDLFSWGHGIFVESGNDWIAGREGFEKISGGRVFTVYLQIGGPYASQGTIRDEFLKYYHQFRKGFPESAVYGFRLKISVNENGESSDCFRFLLPA